MTKRVMIICSWVRVIEVGEDGKGNIGRFGPWDCEPERKIAERRWQLELFCLRQEQYKGGKECTASVL